MTPRLRLLSLGAGVQSTTLALMIAKGEFSEHIDGAIFADTQWEPAATYAHLDWLTAQLPFPVYRVSAGNIVSAVLTRRTASGKPFSAIPWFVTNPDGSKGMGSRQCTSNYKLAPIMWKTRELLNVARTGYIAPGTVEQWIGISTDEASRMKDATQRYITNRWPLIELGMSRKDCLRWLENYRYPTPPKSACIGCPFHDQATWASMRATRPDEFAEACRVDTALRSGDRAGMRRQEFMHAARIPLAEAVEAWHQLDIMQPDLFADLECEGMCGV